MPVTVGVNFLSVVHAASSGITIAFPDVCKTPHRRRADPDPVPEHREVIGHGEGHDEGQVRRQPGVRRRTRTSA